MRPSLKHLPLLEQYPMEAWKTNVLGTLDVLRAAQAVGVETLVNVSTDKAANPTCALGYSERITERLTASFADLDEHTYVSVRFGNVLGSRGSVTDHQFVSSVDVPRLAPGIVDATLRPSPEASAEWMCCAAIPEADVPAQHETTEPQ